MHSSNSSDFCTVKVLRYTVSGLSMYAAFQLIIAPSISYSYTSILYHSVLLYFIKHSYCSWLSVFCYNLYLRYQHCALCFPVFFWNYSGKQYNSFLILGAYTASNIVPLQEIECDFKWLSNYRFIVTFSHFYSVHIVQCIATEILQWTAII